MLINKRVEMGKEDSMEISNKTVIEVQAACEYFKQFNFAIECNNGLATTTVYQIEKWGYKSY